MEYPQQGIRLRSSARTSTGQVRENNEDNIHLWTRENFVLAVVADGMGGAAAGEEASRIAVESIKTGLALRDQDDTDKLAEIEDNILTERLRDAIQTANMKIVEKAAGTPEMRGMGTTVTLAFVRATYAIVAHVGDSRAYLVDGEDHSITQITSDHSFVEALLAAGHITQEQADEHPMKNVLYRALGQADEVDIDMYYKRLHVGDRVILCSDGLTRHVKPAEIAELALVDSNPDIASQQLIDLANERGGEDNVSVIVISVEQTMPTQPPQKEAIIAAENDEDDTLVLKDRLVTRFSLPEVDNLPAEKNQQQEDDSAPETDKPSPSAPPSTTSLIDDHKMLAERLKDEQEADPDSLFPDEDITEDSELVDNDPVDLMRLAPADDDGETEPEMPVVSKEGQVEGRDTLLPDQ